MIKLIACDLDGTLLNREHRLDKSDFNVIQKIEEAGIQFMVATGRSYEGAKDIVEQYGVSYDFITLNGACIQNKYQEILEETPFTISILKDVIKEVHKCDMCYQMYGRDGVITTDAKRGLKEALEHLMRNGMSEEEARDMMEKGKFAIYDLEVADMDLYLAKDPIIYKVELFASDPNKQMSLRKTLSSINGIEVTNSVSDNIEITNIDAQKGIALSKYCDHHQIKKEEVLVFGDSLNDFDMLATFPNSFAVKNAMPEIIEVAHYVTDTNLNHGVAKVLEQLLLHNGNIEFLNNFKK